MQQLQLSNEIYVHPTKGDDTASGDSMHPFKTLTHALQRLKPNSVIQLSRGTYSIETGEVFPLVIPAGALVVGNVSTQGMGVILTGSGIYHSPSFGPQAVTVVLEGDAQLRGVTVTNTAAKGTGIWIEAAAPAVDGCTLAQCSREGMLVTGSANPTITNCAFQQNQASGLTLVRSARGEIRNNLWRQNGFGVAISDRAAPWIVSNQIVENRCGMVLSGAASPILRGNVFAQNREDGLAVFGNANPDLGKPFDPAGNRFRDNQRFDLRNSTSVTLMSSGNQLNPAHVDGAVEFLATRSPHTILTPPALSNRSVPSAPIHAPDDLQHHWAAVLVQPLLDRRLISLLPDGNFHPDATVSATELATWIQNAGFNLTQTKRESYPLTRLQAIVDLVKAAHLNGGHPSLLSHYRDRAQVPSAQTLAVACALQHRLVVSSRSDRLNPLHLITRSEAAAMLYQTLVAKGQAVAIDVPQILVPAAVIRKASGPMPIERPLVVVLDPGHGGADPGVATRPKKTEEQLVQEASMSPMLEMLEMMPMEGIAMSPLPAGAMPPEMLPNVSAGMPPMLLPNSGMPAEMLASMASGMPAGMPDSMPSGMPGDVQETPGLEEKTIVLSVAQAVAGFLQQQGIEVVLTRSDDRTLTAAERIAVAKQHNAAAFVSIHANANLALQSEINGIETYYNPDSLEGMRLAWAIHKTLTRTADIEDRGVHAATFATLRQVPVPAVHVEVGYITGSKDGSSLANLAYHRYLARPIANGILRYVRQPR
jgi:parallel beta-helix repeat protein